MQANEFDDWRRHYYEMTVEDHAEFYRRLHEDHPDQRHFSQESAISFFSQIGRAVSVSELGGYDGALAQLCLDAFPQITTWTNYDIAPGHLSCLDDRYSVHVLKRQLWFLESVAPECFVASHVIEHLSESDLASLMAWAEGASLIYFDSPLHPTEMSNWSGTTAAHALSWSWAAVDALVCSHGYVRFQVDGPAHCFRRIE